MGVDTVSLDSGKRMATHGTHITLLKQNIYGLEFVNNLGQMPAAGAMIYVMPPKIYKASGSPLRLLATWDENNPLKWPTSSSVKQESSGMALVLVASLSLSIFCF